jgi:hypothetical protein
MDVPSRLLTTMALYAAAPTHEPFTQLDAYDGIVNMMPSTAIDGASAPNTLRTSAVMLSTGAVKPPIVTLVPTPKWRPLPRYVTSPTSSAVTFFATVTTKPPVGDKVESRAEIFDQRHPHIFRQQPLHASGTSAFGPNNNTFLLIETSACMKRTGAAACVGHRRREG